MAFNRSRSVGEEKEAEVVGTYRIRFLLSSFCLYFVFLLVFFCRFSLSSLDFRMHLKLQCGEASAPLTGFLLSQLASVAKEGPTRRWWITCSGALLDRVCLSLERGFAAVYLGPGERSVEVCLVCWPV